MIARWEKIDIEEEQWRMTRKKCSEEMLMSNRTVVHLYGTIKRAMNQLYILMKELKNVSGEFEMSLIALT